MEGQNWVIFVPEAKKWYGDDWNTLVGAIADGERAFVARIRTPRTEQTSGLTAGPPQQ